MKRDKQIKIQNDFLVQNKEKSSMANRCRENLPTRGEKGLKKELEQDTNRLSPKTAKSGPPTRRAKPRSDKKGRGAFSLPQKKGYREKEKKNLGTYNYRKGVSAGGKTRSPQPKQPGKRALRRPSKIRASTTRKQGKPSGRPPRARRDPQKKLEPRG